MEEINVNDKIQIISKLRNLDSYIGAIYEKSEAGQKIHVIGHIVCYFDKRPISEDARAHWVAHYFAYPEYQKKEHMKAILMKLLNDSILMEPVSMNLFKLVKVEQNESIIIHEGTIYSDEEIEAAGDQWIQNQIDQSKGN